ncbi:hypothetical protein GLOTRDRAFT_92314 [Gloeophyllum trabeum ATCC 11539]|uniref:Uncharacterized protein n=1 Tax=Gloeophyllum trabeum (strain ATCC 11539 / FP-39264 / Madison 617) TaxID=670483 RepID=S7QCV4_GLOTA|nr:uncharacterized protein GLOTRDRAFT_92314 [Gloeophyllum trabeum ATCC 11539]EPQ57187.1 hypothetical protein GLOTRDRAFT_92314 [Gloeophyllum trabeum ATCC 11539]
MPSSNFGDKRDSLNNILLRKDQEPLSLFTPKTLARQQGVTVDVPGFRSASSVPRNRLEGGNLRNAAHLPENGLKAEKKTGQLVSGVLMLLQPSALQPLALASEIPTDNTEMQSPYEFYDCTYAYWAIIVLS